MRQEGMRFYFDNYSEFLEYAVAHPNHISTAKYYDDWAGNDAPTYEKALEYARKGWTSGRRAIRAITDTLNVAGKVHKAEIQYDVVGDCWDMGRVVSGMPESAMYWEDTEVLQEHGKLIHIIVNTTVSSGINEKHIRARGSAILAMVEALETAGKRVSITMVFTEGDSGAHVEVPIKQLDEQIQDDLVAFAVAHPAFSRRFGHAVTGRGIYPGNPKNPECDIYIPMMMWGEEQWTSEEKTLDWIKGYLEKYGVTYEG